MSPPDERGRPAGSRPADTLPTDEVILEQARAKAREHRAHIGRRACGHGRTYRPCRSCQRARVDAQDELTRIARAEACAMYSAGRSVSQIERRGGLARRSA